MNQKTEECVDFVVAKDLSAEELETVIEHLELKLEEINNPKPKEE